MFSFGQVGGVCERAGSGGRLWFKILDYNLALPNACPPPETFDQIKNSRILEVVNPTKSKLFADGNANWKAVAAEDFPQLKFDSCSHRKYEFAKVLPVAKKKCKKTIAEMKNENGK